MRNDRIKYVLFDLDGTLTDSAEGIINCFIYALEYLGKPIPEREKLYELIGPPLEVNFHDLLGLSDEETARAVKKYRERYSTVGLFENRPYEGIEEMLGDLKNAGFTLAVSTCKPEVFAVRILEKFGLARYFAVITGSSLDGTRNTKAEVITETMKRLGTDDRDSAVMVGDRRYDVIGAREVGMRCIGAGWGFADEGELEESGASPIAVAPSELAEILIGNRI